MMEALRKAMDDPAPGVRAAAIEHITIPFEKLPPDMVLSIVKALGDSDPVVRDAAENTLSRAMIAGAVPELLAMLGNPSPDIRARAASCLRRLDDPPESVINALQILVKDEDRECRIEAAAALAANGIKAQNVIDEVLVGLKNSDAKARRGAFEEAFRFRKVAEDEIAVAAVEWMRRPLEESDLQEVFKQIQSFGGSAFARVIEESVNLLASDDPKIRSNGVAVALRMLRDDGEPSLRAAVAVLHAPGITDAEAIDLVKRLEHLTKMRDGSVAVPYLFEALSHPSAAVRREAVVRLPLDAAGAGPALRKLFADLDRTVVAASLRKLVKVEDAAHWRDANAKEAASRKVPK